LSAGSSIYVYIFCGPFSFFLFNHQSFGQLATYTLVSVALVALQQQQHTQAWQSHHQALPVTKKNLRIEMNERFFCCAQHCWREREERKVGKEYLLEALFSCLIYKMFICERTMIC